MESSEEMASTSVHERSCSCGETAHLSFVGTIGELDKLSSRGVLLKTCPKDS